jgi:hypothetical protein
VEIGKQVVSDRNAEIDVLLKEVEKQKARENYALRAEALSKAAEIVAAARLISPTGAMSLAQSASLTEWADAVIQVAWFLLGVEESTVERPEDAVYLALEKERTESK